MRPEQITTLDDQVVELIRKYQQEHQGQAMPYATLLEQFEKLLVADQKFKSADYFTPVLTNLKGFNRIQSHEDADGKVSYETVEQ